MDSPEEECSGWCTEVLFGVPARRAVLLLCLAFAALLATIARARRRQAQGETSACCSTPARPVSVTPMASTVVARSSRAALETAGYTVDWEDCTNNGGGATNCDNADKNPRIFTDDEPRPLRRDRPTELLGRALPARLWTTRRRPSIIKYVQNGGGIAGVHNATDMGTTADDVGLVGRQQRQLGRRRDDARPRRDRASPTSRQVQVADHNHLATARPAGHLRLR